MSVPVYRQRKPQSTPYYQCIEDHFEKFEQVYEEQFERQYGFFRPYVKQVIYRYLDCGILHNGFARVRCKDCGHEYLLAFSCKRRHFCPSCHQKRVVEFGEWLCGEVLKSVPHRHFVFSIPKILRKYFLYDRKLLIELSRSTWQVLKIFLMETVPEKDPLPGAVIAIQTFGDFLGFNPHCHILCTDGCFYGKGMFRVARVFDVKKLERLFQHQILKMLLSKGKITKDLIAMLSNWRHSGFNVFCGPRIQPGDKQAMENLARYIIRASFSQERMTYIPEESKVVYKSKDDKKEEIFDAFEWLAAMCSHVPNKGEQMVRYGACPAVTCGSYYSNVARGKRKICDQDELIPSILEPDESSKERRKNWSRLIQKIYEIDPLTCPKCSGAMKVISVIEDGEIVKKILKHLGLWDRKARPPPKATGPPEVLEYSIDYSTSQIQASDNLSRASRSNEWLYVDVEYQDAYPSLF